MDKLIELFKNMDTMQLVLLAGAVFLFFNQGGLKGLSEWWNGEEAKKPETVDAVDKWQELYAVVKSNGLLDAQKKLDEVFPLLIKKAE